MSGDGRATTDTLASLHDALADELIVRIREHKASPTDLSVARQFLKDNGISCEPGKNPKMGILVDELPDHIPDGDQWRETPKRPPGHPGILCPVPELPHRGGRLLQHQLPFLRLQARQKSTGGEA